LGSRSILPYTAIFLASLIEMIVHSSVHVLWVLFSGLQTLRSGNLCFPVSVRILAYNIEPMLYILVLCYSFLLVIKIWEVLFLFPIRTVGMYIKDCICLQSLYKILI
jgi:hypothetical protein